MVEKMKNSNLVIMTAVAIVIALIAVAYALYAQNKSVQKVRVAVPTMDISQVEYEAGSDNPVVLTLNGRDITREEIMDNFEASGSQLPAGADMEQVFPLLQDQYLVGEMLEQAARDEGFTQNSPEIARQMNYALDQSLRAAYIRSVGERNVTDADVRQAYEDIIANAPVITERRASHILVDSEDTAQSLIEELNDGADFAELAEANSQGPTSVKGGDLGFFAASDMVPEFSEAAFSMNVGEVSENPVQTQFGYHIIKVTDERTREKPSFEQISEQLKDQLRQAVIAERLQEMRAGADIVVYDYNGDPVERPESVQPSVGSETPAATEENTESVTQE